MDDTLQTLLDEQLTLPPEYRNGLRGCKRNLRLARYAVIETKRSEAASATQQSARAPRAQTVFERRARCGAARDHARATSLIVG
jgi:hypothetical protein